MNLSTSCLPPAVIDSLLEGDLSPEELAAAEVHLTDCPTCRSTIEQTLGAEEWCDHLKESLGSTADESLATEGSQSPLWEKVTTTRLMELLGPTDDPAMLGRIGSYEIIGLLGHGGMGAVFKGYDRSLNRFVAIKMLLPHLAVSGAARKRFLREGQAVAAVVDDHVMAIHCVDEWQGIPYLVMTYSRGISLQKRLNDQGPLDLREILRIGLQAAKGLAAAHAQGIVHRDVKPANIFLDEHVERVQLMDFGLARAADDASLTHSGMLAGTPQYMSPEQARAEVVDSRSDLFSLGAVMYAMCTGRAPFRAESSYGILRLITDKEPRPIREINPDVPEWLCAVVAKLMAKQADDRYQSADEVAELLEACLAHVQDPTSVPLPKPLRRFASSTDSNPARRSLGKWIAGVCCGLAVLFAGILIVLETSKGKIRIESQADGVPIRILQADQVVEELTLTKNGASVRIAAGEYLIELGGKTDGLTVENETVTLQRGGHEVVKIVKETHPPGHTHSLSGHEDHAVPQNSYEAYLQAVENLRDQPFSMAARRGHWEYWLPRLLKDFHATKEAEDRRSLGIAALGIANALEEYRTSEMLLRELIILSRNNTEAARWQAELEGIHDRNRNEMTTKVLEWIGLSLRPISKDNFREKNVFANYAGGMDVTFVRSHGPAEKAGINEVDIIVRLQEKAVSDRDDLDLAMEKAVNQIQEGDADALQFDVLRSGETVRVNVPFPARELDVKTLDQTAAKDDSKETPHAARIPREKRLPRKAEGEVAVSRGDPPTTEAEKAIARLVLVFFNDRSRRAIPAVLVDGGSRTLIVTAGPACSVPDGEPAAIDRIFLEMPGRPSLETRYLPESTKELFLWRTGENLTNYRPTEPVELKVGDELSGILPEGLEKMFVKPNVARIVALDAKAEWTTPVTGIRFQSENLLQIDRVLPEGTPLFKDGKLAGLTLLGTRFLGEQARKSYVVPVERITSLLQKIETEKEPSDKNANGSPSEAPKTEQPNSNEDSTKATFKENAFARDS